MRSFRLLYWLVAWLFCGCDPAGMRWPEARFDLFAVQRPLDLARILGNTVTLLSSTDTLQLRIAYDPSTKLNKLTDATSNEVVLMARVFRFRKLYYLVEQLPNSSC